MSKISELGLTVQTLKRINKELFQQYPKQIADVYLAAVALLCHLKEDQATLFQIRDKQGENPKCPPPKDIPAITAVLQDADLFRCLLVCLQQSGSDGSDGTDSSKPASLMQAHHLHSSTVGRKRSLSLVNDYDSNRGSMKSAKLAMSPGPSGPRQFHHHSKLHQGAADRGKPRFNLQVVSASILYAALRHLDHWPAPLVAAYAEDCFGPRTWVDEDGCRMLVDNLKLAHAPLGTGGDEKDSPEVQQDAALVEEAYRKIKWTNRGGGGSPDRLAATQTMHRSHSGSTVQPGRVVRERSVDSIDIGMSHSKHQSCAHGEEDFCALDKQDGAAVSRGGGSDSSSGEEDEEVVVMADSTNGDSPNVIANKKAVANKTPLLYPLPPKDLNLERVRPRYFASNLEYAQKLISVAFSTRLDIRSKQNSNLLHALPEFTSIASLRSLVASNLQKWLQSAALAGLARALFTSIVKNMKNVDPPLPEDLRVIDCILAMRLKANQLNAHIENITTIASRIPTGSVGHHLYSTLLRETLQSGHDGSMLAGLDQLKMIAAVHASIPSTLSYDAFAASLLQILVNPEKEAVVDAAAGRDGRDKLVRKLKIILRTVAMSLGPQFDGFQLLNALLSFDVTSTSWTSRDEEDKARLMFQCITLAVSQFQRRSKGSKNGHSKGSAPNGTNSSHLEGTPSLKASIDTVRQLLITWCCSDYGPRYSSKVRQHRPKRNGARKPDEVIGAGAPDFSSALGPESEERIPIWLNTMRCLLFMEDADSPLMKHFVMADKLTSEDETDWNKEQERIKICCRHGGDLNNQMIWTILESTDSGNNGMEPSMAIQLLENIFESCGRSKRGSLKIHDPNIVWELYNLVKYVPNESAIADEIEELPRLAYPGLWWRVTILALVICSQSPSKVGAVVWKEHPTLRALIKMVTSDRYRFPTVDCDELSRDEMKQLEQKAREQEGKVAEDLFLPPRKDKEKEKKGGSRMSRRLLKKKQDKEAAVELEETTSRRRMLKYAQRSIMLWDPDGPARKPPAEAAKLLLSVEDIFQLSSSFQRSVEPDFLLFSIGTTDRASIERAYDWLIPIISKIPSTISRLPSNASCFLLLRAYGSSPAERAQLKQLSAPLLRHVEDSLQGKNNEMDSLKAFDLLMSDVASHNPDRRRCARRVLHDALAVANDSPLSSDSWMLTILRLKYAKALVTSAIKHMTEAAAFERGRVLRSLLLALEKYIDFANGNSIALDTAFPALLVDLVSRRPNVYADAMDAYADLLTLVVRIVHSEFSRCSTRTTPTGLSNSEVSMTIRKDGEGKEEAIVVSPGLLKATSVLLSIWKESIGDSGVSAESVNSLVGTLLIEEGVSFEQTQAKVYGLSSAKFAGTDKIAMTVEFWIMLAKARSDTIARRAALSAPARFLPRLLLCTGLPTASLLAMIDRLGRLGESSEETNALFISLMTPSVSSEWDIGRVGSRKEVYRKLLGRLAAYMRINAFALGDRGISMTFLHWLSDECKANPVAPKKSRGKKVNKSVSASIPSIEAASSVRTLVTNSSLLFAAEAMDIPDVDLPVFHKAISNTKAISNDGET